MLAHLVGVMEDAAAGRIAGPPDAEATAAEVARHAEDGPVDLLATWGELSPDFEAVVSAGGMWPAFFDVLSHEHDVRHAVGVPGAHDSDQVRLAAKLLVRSVDVGRPLHVDTGDTVLASRTGEGDPIVLRASAFEAFRFRLGRRSRDQVARARVVRGPRRPARRAVRLRPGGAADRRGLRAPPGRDALRRTGR